jgi:hypothetical protein
VTWGGEFFYSEGQSGSIGEDGVDWGLREDGRLEYWSYAEGLTLSLGEPEEPLDSIEGSEATMCGLTPYGTVRCWGYFTY